MTPSVEKLIARLEREYTRTGAYAPEATCRHGEHPYDCRQGCAPPTFEAADALARQQRVIEKAANDADDLLEDMQLHGLHNAEYYPKAVALVAFLRAAEDSTALTDSAQQEEAK